MYYIDRKIFEPFVWLFRFFIDFPDLTQQHNKLFKFLDNHFHGKSFPVYSVLVNIFDINIVGYFRRQ